MWTGQEVDEGGRHGQPDGHAPRIVDVKPGRTRQIVGGLAALLLMVGLGEAVLRGAYGLRNSRVESIPLPYVVGDDYGPQPPWADGVRILEPDEALIWRNRSGVRRRYVDVFSPVRAEADRVAIHRRFWPSLPESLAHNPTWEIVLNSQGFRTAEFQTAKPAARVRVVCLGDSWTFGANVGQDDAYPQRLQALLRRAFPDADVEVLNLGVLGYSSFQGRELLRRRVLALDPDVVVIGFAMNDAKVAGFHDEDLVGAKAPSPASRLAALAGRSEVFRLLRYLALSLRHRPVSLRDHLEAADVHAADAQRRTATPEAYATFERWTRVPLPDYERNLSEMVTLARTRGASVVLLFNELWEDDPYRAAVARVARSTGVPFVDSLALIARARRQMEADREGALGLAAEPARGEAAAGDDVEVVFRVEARDQPVPTGLSIVGAHPALGALVPNRVAMHDDGTHGDQRAGDGVWSYAARFAPGTRLSYVYTNSGREGRWEGLDVPALRSLVVDGSGGRRLYRPIESFGRIRLQADSWHTDATGHALIAQAVFEVLTREERLTRRLAGRLPAPHAVDRRG